MKVRNVHYGPVLVADITIVPRRVVTIQDDEWRDWLGRSSGNKQIAAACLEIVEHPVDPEQVNRVESAIEAIKLMSPDEPTHWTVDGKPTLQALRQVSGMADLSVRERDRAWAIVNGSPLPPILPNEDDLLGIPPDDDDPGDDPGAGDDPAGDI